MITLLEQLQSAVAKSFADLNPLFTGSVALVEPVSCSSKVGSFELSHAVLALVARPAPLVLASLYPKTAFQTPRNHVAEPFSDLFEEPFTTVLRLPAAPQHLRDCSQMVGALPYPTEEQIHGYRQRWISHWYSQFDAAILHRLTSQLLGLHTASPTGRLTDEEGLNIGRARATVREFRSQLDSGFLSIDALLAQAQLRLESVLARPHDFPAAQEALFEFHQLRAEIEKLACQHMQVATK